MDKTEILRASLMAAIILLEWWLMQPYHEPVIARLWDMIARWARFMAARFGWLALHAEHNYYIAAEAGI